jgi:hypothetical protein
MRLYVHERENYHRFLVSGCYTATGNVGQKFEEKFQLEQNLLIKSLQGRLLSSAFYKDELFYCVGILQEVPRVQRISFE